MSEIIRLIRVPLLFLFCWVTFTGLAQESTPSYAFLLAHNITTTPVYNPAYVSDYRADFQVHNFNFTGAFSEIGATLFQGSLRLYQSTGNQKHHLGLIAFNEREGPPISRQRIYVHYRFSQPLNSKWTLGAGSNLGLAGFVINGSSVNSKGSGYAPDGVFGLWVRHPQLEFGAALQQAFETEFRPIQETFILPRHFMGHLFWHQDVGKIKITPFLRTRRRPETTDVDSGIKFTYANTAMVGFDHRWQEAITFQLGLKEIPLGNWVFRADALYYVALQQATATRNNGFEIQLGVRLPELTETPILGEVVE